MENYQCKICGNTANNRPLKVRALELCEEFQYVECADCGCLQIIELPKDMEKYYDSNTYYSYHMQVKKSKLRDWFHKLLFSLYTCRLLPADLPYLRVFPALHILRKVSRNAAILDIGCGDGRLVQDMGVWGYKNCTGIDPFIEKDAFYQYNVKVLKQNTFEHIGQYDLIMMHHSLEHLAEQHKIFNELYRLLKPDGTLLIRVPVADGYPYRKYGTRLYSIDAPRHYYLHTTQSIFTLAQANGFVLKNVEHDSSMSYFVNKYKQTGILRDIAIPKKQKRILNKQIKLMNAMYDGGAACFMLKKRLS